VKLGDVALTNRVQNRLYQTDFASILRNKKAADFSIKSRLSDVVEMRRLELLTPYMRSRCRG
jgi:hypothetical protein